MSYSPNAVLPDSQEGILLGLLETLNALLSTAAGIDPLTRRLRVTVESNVALPANQSSNVAQFGGNNVVTGTGVGGNGIPRVTPSSDTVSGITAATQVQQSWHNVALGQLYSNIAVS